MNLCVNGHDRDKVGATSNRECRGCKNDRKRAVRESARLAREAREAEVHELERIAALDGLEDEYGPCPPPESDYTWFDEMAVDNAIFGGLARPLTRLERAEFIRRTSRWEPSEVALCGRLSVDEVKVMRSYRLKADAQPA